MSWFDRAAALLSRDDGRLALDGDGDLRLAVAALLVEAALMDDRFECVRAAGNRRSAVPPLRSDGRAGSVPCSPPPKARCGNRPSSSASPRPSPRSSIRAERARIVEMLWEVAYADGVLSPQEDALIRRIAGLVYVDDADRMAARRRVRERLGLAGLTPGGRKALSDRCSQRWINRYLPLSRRRAAARTCRPWHSSWLSTTTASISTFCAMF